MLGNKLLLLLLFYQASGRLSFVQREPHCFLACHAQEPGHLLHDPLTSHPYRGHQQRKSRHPFVPAALELLRDASELGTSAARWANHRWSIEWREGTSRLHSFFDDVDALPPGMGLSTPAYVWLNRLRTGVGLFGSLIHKWGMAFYDVQ